MNPVDILKHHLVECDPEVRQQRKSELGRLLTTTDEPFEITCPCYNLVCGQKFTQLPQAQKMLARLRSPGMRTACLQKRNADRVANLIRLIQDDSDNKILKQKLRRLKGRIAAPSPVRRITPAMLLRHIRYLS